MRTSARRSARPKRRSAEVCFALSSCCAKPWRRKEALMQCRTVLTRVDAMRTGELEGTEKHSVGSHLQTCRSCNASLSAVEQLALDVKSLALIAPHSLSESAPADWFDRIDNVWVAFSRRGLRMIHRGSS